MSTSQGQAETILLGFQETMQGLDTSCNLMHGLDTRRNLYKLVEEIHHLLNEVQVTVHYKMLSPFPTCPS